MTINVSAFKVNPFATICLLISFLIFPSFAQELSDSQVKEAMIKESIAHYSGNCPCPYNTTRNGQNCGRRSAYSKPGGYTPKCYASDISPQEIVHWRNRQSSRFTR